MFAAHMGDITENGTVASEWTRASNAMAILDSAGVPYSVTPGNHDGWASGYPNYLATFGADRFAGKAWYGGYLGDPADGIDDFGVNRGNLDSYQLFSAERHGLHRPQPRARLSTGVPRRRLGQCGPRRRTPTVARSSPRMPS